VHTGRSTTFDLSFYVSSYGFPRKASASTAHKLMPWNHLLIVRNPHCLSSLGRFGGRIRSTNILTWREKVSCYLLPSGLDEKHPSTHARVLGDDTPRHGSSGFPLNHKVVVERQAVNHATPVKSSAITQRSWANSSMLYMPQRLASPHTDLIKSHCRRPLVQLAGLEAVHAI
jgi:hypothetical protein